MRCDAPAGSFFVGRVPAAGRRRRKKRFSSLCRGVPSEPRTDFIEVVCTEHIGRKTGCLPLKRGIGPGRLSVVAVRRGRLDEPCRAAAQRGIPRAGGPHLRAAGAPLDGRRRRGGRQGDGARLAPCVGRYSIVRPWGCRCVGGGGAMKRCRRRTAASWARRLCGPGRLLRSRCSMRSPKERKFCSVADAAGGFGCGARGCASADAAGRGALDERCAGRLRIAVRPEPQTADARIGRIFFGMRVSRRIGEN